MSSVLGVTRSQISRVLTDLRSLEWVSTQPTADGLVVEWNPGVLQSLEQPPEVNGQIQRPRIHERQNSPHSFKFYEVTTLGMSAQRALDWAAQGALDTSAPRALDAGAQGALGQAREARPHLSADPIRVLELELNTTNPRRVGAVVEAKAVGGRTPTPQTHPEHFKIIHEWGIKAPEKIVAICGMDIELVRANCAWAAKTLKGKENPAGWAVSCCEKNRVEFNAAKVAQRRADLEHRAVQLVLQFKPTMLEVLPPGDVEILLSKYGGWEEMYHAVPQYMRASQPYSIAQFLLKRAAEQPQRVAV